MLNRKSFLEGLRFVPKATSTADTAGELEVLSSDNRLRYFDGTTLAALMTSNSVDVITNKTIDANATGNSISNLETADLAAGVLNTSTSLAGATNSQIPSALAAKTYADNVSSAGAAAVQANLDAHINDTVDAHDASAISNIPSGNLSATDQQAANNELQADIDSRALQADLLAHINNTTGAHAASAISNVPSGNLASTNVQSALNELQSDIDTRVVGPVSANDNRVARFDTTSGKLIQSSIVEIDDLANTVGMRTLTTTVGITTPELNVTTDFNESIQSDSTTTGTGATLVVTAPIVRLSNASLVSISMLSGLLNAGQNVTVINQTGNNITINDKTGATANQQIETGTKAALTLKDEASIILKYDSVETKWVVVGGTGSAASSGINYDTNPDADLSTTGYAVYADAAASAPVDGTGGSANVTFTTSSSAPLRGLNSFVFTKDAANRQGQGGSYDFTIDSADQASILTIAFDYSTSANYVDTVSGNLIDSDMRMYVYDVTNSQLIEMSQQNIAANVQGHYVGTFQTNSNSTSYRLIFHVASTNASAYTLKFDNVQVGPRNNVKGTIVATQDTNIQQAVTFGAVDITGALTGSTRGNTLYTYNSGTGIYTALKEIKVDISVSFSNAGAAKSQPTIVFPGVGTFGLAVSSATTGDWISASATYIAPAGQTWKITNGGPGSTNSQRITVSATYVAGNVTLSEDTGNRIVACRANLTANQAVATTAVTTVLFNSAPIDTTSSFNTSTGTWTCPESGIYNLSTQVTIQLITAADATVIRMRKNGSDIANNSTDTITTDNNLTRTITRIESLVKGDTITVVTDSASDASYNISGNTVPEITYLSINKISSPQTLAGSETVAVRAVQSSGQTIGTSVTLVTWDATKTYDTHNAFSSSLGVFTSPVSGVYKINTHFLFASTAWTSTAEPYMFYFKNGAQYSSPSDSNIQGSFTGFVQLSGNDTVYLNKGDTLSVYLANNSGTNKNLFSSSATNYISINLVK